MAESGGGSSQGKSGKSVTRLKPSRSDKTPQQTRARVQPERRSQATGRRPSQARQEGKRVEVYRVDGIARRGFIRHVKIVGGPGEWSVFGVDGLKTQVPGQTIEEAVRRARRRFGFYPLTIRRIEADGSFGQSIAVLPPPARDHRR